MVLERLSATRDAHDACHVVRVMRHGFDELFRPPRFIDHVRPCSGYDFVSLSLSLYISLSRFQRLMTVARDKLYLCGISIAADGLYLARGLQALKIIFVEIELQIGEVIKCC